MKTKAQTIDLTSKLTQERAERFTFSPPGEAVCKDWILKQGGGGGALNGGVCCINVQGADPVVSIRRPPTCTETKPKTEPWTRGGGRGVAEA